MDQGDTPNDSLSQPQLAEAKAASVALIKHAPCSDIWNEAVQVGMKLEVKHADVATPPPLTFTYECKQLQPAFWVVTIIKIHGYYILVRYEGMGEDASRDFWMHVGVNELHPIGAETHNGILVPPQFVKGKVGDWRNYIVNNLCGAKTFPVDFLRKLRASVNESKYRIGDQLEVIDKYKISQLRGATVKKIIGRRMYLRYNNDHNDGFFGHENSSVIYPGGWAERVGHPIQAPHKTTSLLLDNSMPILDWIWTSPIAVGMMLEAVDPLCPGRICAASICKLLKYGYIMIQMESYDKAGIPESDRNNDWFCYHITSPHIFNCGYCDIVGIPLVPPYGWPVETFSWTKYLGTTGKIAATIEQQPEVCHQFKIGMQVEMADLMTPMKIHAATIVEVYGRMLRINFDGWDPDFDQWLDCESPDIYPVGWCALVGHRLETPTENTNGSSKCGKRRKLN